MKARASLWVFWGWALTAPLFAFDSYEHIATGTMGVNLKFPNDPQIHDDFPYKSFYDLLLEPNNKAQLGKIEYSPQYILITQGQKTLKLGYGEIIALAGDFIGVTDHTISDGMELKHFNDLRDKLEKNFNEAFENLLPFDGNSVYARGNLEYLRGLFKNEYKSMINNLSKPYGVHFNNASSHSVTSKVKDQWAYAKSPGYSDLLSINVDHFENDAKLSYAIGHAVALDKAKKAFETNQKGDPEKALEQLNMAYATDAFASHFLTDLFSAGHLRTPRGPLFEISKSLKNKAMGYTITAVGLMANAMHDEDNYIGLWLRDGDGQVWKAFGDGSYFDVKSQDNRQAIKEALQASVDEVYKTFETGVVTKFKDFRALKQVGVPLEVGSDFVHQLVNHYPLFQITKNGADVRKNYYDNATKDYQPISSITSISSFIKSDLGTFNHANFISFINEANLVDSLKREIMVECYNTFDRESIWPSKPRDYVVLKDLIPMILVDNKQLQFYKSVLQGNLRPDGVYYVVNEEMGERIMAQCKRSMETSFTIQEAFSPDVIEIRGRIDRGYSHPIVVFDKDGNLRRLKGYKS